MKKEIKDYPGYSVDEEGNIYSNKMKKEKQLKSWIDSKGNYLYVSLCKNNHKENRSVHSLVAETFIPNLNNLPEIDHLDKNKLNNQVKNLRWCTRKENLEHSYSTMSPVRNYKITELIIEKKHIGYFKSTVLACRYAAIKGYSYSSLMKYKHSGTSEIIQLDVTTIENGEKIIESLTEVE